jgi:hypothetical protein
LSDKANGFRDVEGIDLNVVLDQAVFQMTCKQMDGWMDGWMDEWMDG